MSSLKPDTVQKQRVAILVEALQEAIEKLGCCVISKQTLQFIVKSYIEKYDPVDLPSNNDVECVASIEDVSSQMDSQVINNVIKIDPYLSRRK